MLALIIAAMLYATLLYVWGCSTARYAALRGRSKIGWFILGSLFYPVPYVALALLPSTPWQAAQTCPAMPCAFPWAEACPDSKAAAARAASAKTRIIPPELRKSRFY